MSDSPKASLTAALNDLLREEFDGVPSNDQIARALSKIVASGGLPPRQAILLDALSMALDAKSGDGWYLESLKGPRSKRTKIEQKARSNKGKIFGSLVAAGCDASAREKLKGKPGMGVAKAAYYDDLPKNRLRRFMRGRLSHERRIEELRYIAEKSDDD